MSLEIFNCEQRSPEWWACRSGIPTASEFATVLAKGKGGGESVTRRKYLNTLAGEVITGEPAESYDNPFMERGRMQEGEARELYAFAHDAEPQLIGFIRNGNKGCSPDALLGTDGILEIKTAKASILIDYLLHGAFPSEHVAQCQGELWIAEREWIDIAIYSPRLPLFVKRATRDEKYIADLAKAVEAFNAELAEIVERVRRYGDREALGRDLRASLQVVA